MLLLQVKEFTSLSHANWAVNFHKSLLSLFNLRHPDSSQWDGQTSSFSYTASEVHFAFISNEFPHLLPIDFVDDFSRTKSPEFAIMFTT